MGIRANKLKERELNMQYNMWREEMNRQSAQFDVSRLQNQKQFDATMAYNKWALENQQQYNRQMYDYAFQMESEYNSASAQRQRLEAAGLNPYMMMNGGSAGVATAANAPTSSSSSGPSPSGVSAPGLPGIPQLPTGNWENAIGGILGKIIDGLYQLRVRKSQANNIDADTKGKVIDNKTRDALNVASLLDKRADVRSKEARAFIDETVGAIKDQTRNFDIEKARWDALNTKAQNAVLLAQSSLSNAQLNKLVKETNWIDKEKSYQLSLVAAQTYSYYASGKASYAQARKAVAEAVLAEKSPYGQFSDKQAKLYASYFLDKSQYDAMVRGENWLNMYYYGSEEAPEIFDSGQIDLSPLPGSTIKSPHSRFYNKRR